MNGRFGFQYDNDGFWTNGRLELRRENHGYQMNGRFGFQYENDGFWMNAKKKTENS